MLGVVGLRTGLRAWETCGIAENPRLEPLECGVLPELAMLRFLQDTSTCTEARQK